MNLKNKLLAVSLIGFFILAAVPYCRAQTTETAVNKAAIEQMVKEDFSIVNGKTGNAIVDRWGEENLKALTNVSCDCKIEKFIYCNTITDCLAMIKSGRADFMLTTDVTAAYVAERNQDIKAIIAPGELGAVMMLRASDSSLRDSFNAAIKKLKESGRIGELEKKWIKELPVGQEPAGTKIEKTADTETVYVGVSGDMPPLDYVAADGKPAGFNVALLGEISKLIGKNIEVVSIDSQARFAALESKKIDVFFWIIMPTHEFVREKLKENADEQAFYKKFTFTEPHCLVKTGLLMKK